MRPARADRAHSFGLDRNGIKKHEPARGAAPRLLKKDGRPPALACATCEYVGPDDVAEMTHHLVTAHALTAEDAAARARAIADDRGMWRFPEGRRRRAAAAAPGEREEATPMATGGTRRARHCRACGETGHRANRCPHPWERAEERRRQEQVRRDAEVARWKKALPQILEAVAAAVKKAPARAGGLLGTIVLKACAGPRYGHKDDTAAYVPRGTTAEDMLRHAAFAVLQEEIQAYGAFEDFPKRAKAFSVDVRKIVDRGAPPVQMSAPAAAPRRQRT